MVKPYGILNVIKSTFILLILFSLFFCKERAKSFNSKIKFKNQTQILETEEAHIASLKKGILLNQNHILLLSSRTEILNLDTQTGNCSLFFNFDILEVDTIYNQLKKAFPNVNFIENEYKNKEYTYQINQLTINNNYLYVATTTQFFIEAKYNEEQVSYFSFFGIILKINTETKKIEERIIVPQSPKVNLSSSPTGSFISPSGGFEVKDKTIFIKNVTQPISDTSCFIYSFTKKDSLLTNKKLLRLNSNKNKQPTNINLSDFSFYHTDSNIYCSDGKDIFSINDETQLYNIINNKQNVIKSFKINDDNSIWIVIGSDTSPFNSLNYFKNNSLKGIIPNSEKENLFILDSLIYSIYLEGDNYFLNIYEENNI